MPGREGQIIAQKYTLQRLVGQGGMGAVWQAHHGALDSPVAVKLLSAEGGSELGARFRREAQAAARLRSPNVVQVLDCGVEAGYLFIVMELLEGEDLRQRLARVGQLDREEAYRIVLSVKRVLRRAHAVGIIHRDLKPGNIYLARHDDIEILKILDFGIAKSLFEQGITMPGMLLGTPGYTSPEQSLGMDGVDHRADLWALAVIVYRMLTGRLPFPGRNSVEILQASLRGTFDPPSRIEPSLGSSVDDFFFQAFARSVNDRFPDVITFTQNLADALGVDPRISSVSLDGSIESETRPSSPPRESDGHPRAPVPSSTKPAVTSPPVEPPPVNDGPTLPAGPGAAVALATVPESPTSITVDERPAEHAPVRIPEATSRSPWSAVTALAIALLAILAFLGFSALFSKLFGEG